MLLVVDLVLPFAWPTPCSLLRCFSTERLLLLRKGWLCLHAGVSHRKAQSIVISAYSLESSEHDVKDRCESLCVVGNMCGIVPI